MVPLFTCLKGVVYEIGGNELSLPGVATCQEEQADDKNLILLLNQTILHSCVYIV